MAMPKDYIQLYRKVLGSDLKERSVAVYGISNYDDVFRVSEKKLSSLKINPVFDDIAERVIKSNSYREYNRDIEHINDAIIKLKKALLKEKVILGGNATNISLGLAALGNDVHLNVKRTTPQMIQLMKKEGLKSIKSTIDEAAHHLIVQVREHADRFIISPDYGMEEPELVDFVDETCEFSVYSGAHLDAKNQSVQSELLRRVKNISNKSKLYFEMGSGSRLAEDNCIKVSSHADIVGMNEIELETIAKGNILEEKASAYHKTYMKKDSVLVVHTVKGSLAVSGKPVENIQMAQALGHLSGSSRYIYGRYLRFGEIRKRFEKLVLYEREIKNTADNVSWVPGIIYEDEGLAVGSGDGYVAGFVTGYLNFCNPRT